MRNELRGGYGESGRFELLALSLFAACFFTLFTFAAGGGSSSKAGKVGDPCPMPSQEQKECTTGEGGGGDSGGDAGGGGGKGKGKKKKGGPKCCICGESKQLEEKKSEAGGPKGSCKNDNKGGDGGGQMPQMPQIPQQQQQQQDPQQSNTETASYPTDTKTTAETSANQIQSSALGDDKKDKGDGPMNGVQFGQSLANAISAVTEPRPGSPGGNPLGNQKSSGGNGLGQNGLGQAPGAGGFGSTGGGGGGPSGGGGGSTGASTAGDAPKEKAADSNPFEVNAGGGRLSAPKGKSGGGEPDSVVDAKATDKFDQDFKGAKEEKKGDAEAATEDEGFTIFRMINSKYAELKKRGSI